MNRTPPAAVRRVLRQEVNFGCPVNGCGFPYLTYHHFNPSWSEQQHHDIEGMIALCLLHHKQADVGTFTQEQIFQLKQQVTAQRVSGRFNWNREQLFIIAGSNFFLGTTSVLEIGTEKLIWFGESENGFGTINMDLYSQAGQLLLSMRDNDWVALPFVDDIECPLSGNRLTVRAKQHGVSLT